VKYFYNNTNELSYQYKRFFNLDSKDKYIINVIYYEKNKNRFPLFINDRFFDQDFILKYYLTIVTQVYDNLKDLLITEQSALFDLFKSVVETKKFPAQDEIKNQILHAQNQAKDPLNPWKSDCNFYFSKAFYGACCGLGGIEYDLARALANIYNDPKIVQEKENFYLNQFKQVLIQQMFDYYPEETKRFKKIKVENDIKLLLKL
jgi:hypothetical protein